MSQRFGKKLLKPTFGTWIIEETVKQSVIEEFDNNTALIQASKIKLKPTHVLPGNNESSVKQSAAQQFDADTLSFRASKIKLKSLHSPSRQQ